MQGATVVVVLDERFVTPEKVLVFLLAVTAMTPGFMQLLTWCRDAWHCGAVTPIQAPQVATGAAVSVEVVSQPDAVSALVRQAEANTVRRKTQEVEINLTARVGLVVREICHVSSDRIALVFHTDL